MKALMSCENDVGIFTGKVQKGALQNVSRQFCAFKFKRTSIFIISVLVETILLICLKASIYEKLS